MPLIENADDQRVDLYRDLRGMPESHKEAGFFLAEGRICVERLLRSEIEVHSIFATHSFFDQDGIEKLAQKRAKSRCFVAEKQLMNSVVGFKLHQAVLAIGRRPATRELAEIEFPALGMDAMINAENVGAIVRSCRAFGIKSLIVDGRSASPYIRRSVRVSMGTIFDLPLYEVANLESALQEIQSKHQAHIIAAETSEGAQVLSNVKFPAEYLLVIGSENNGISSAVLDVADTVVEIPINAEVGSINAGAAAAVLLYAAQSQLEESQLEESQLEE